MDTGFGVPLFCPRVAGPVCGDVESETYQLDGELLSPGGVAGERVARVAERGDFTRVVETAYEQITRHGDGPGTYFWEVRDKAGNVSWYGGYPDAGGTVDSAGVPGTRTGAARNDATIARSAIVADDAGNGVRWLVKARRDVGGNLVRYEYDTVHYRGVSGAEWDGVDAGGLLHAGGAVHVCAAHVLEVDLLHRLCGVGWPGRW